MAADENIHAHLPYKRLESVIVVNQNYRGPLVMNNCPNIILINNLTNQDIADHSKNEYITKKRKIIIQRNVRIAFKPGILNKKQRLLRYWHEHQDSDNNIPIFANPVDLSIMKHNVKDNPLTSVLDSNHKYIKGGNFEDEYIKQYEMETYGMPAKKYFHLSYNSESLTDHSDIYQIVCEPLNLSSKIMNDSTLKCITRTIDYQHFLCDNCNFKCSEELDLKKHSEAHINITTFSCDKCKYKCRLLYKMRIHKRMIHKNQGKMLLLKKNRKLKKTGAKPVTPSVSKIYRNLKVHKRIHVDIKRYFCDTCKFKCILAVSLKRHKMKCHTKNNNMKISNRCLKSLNSNRREVKPYVCRKYHFNNQSHDVIRKNVEPSSVMKMSYKSCKKEMNCNRSLKAHRLFHSGQRPYACDLCSYTSKELALLSYHKHQHTNQIPYSCNTCNFECRTRNILSRHTIKH